MTPQEKQAILETLGYEFRSWRGEFEVYKDGQFLIGSTYPPNVIEWAWDYEQLYGAQNEH
jgi:hypothetical protein